jgi:hypothetical protein
MCEAFKMLWNAETSTVTERQDEGTKNYHKNTTMKDELQILPESNENCLQTGTN